MHRDNFAARAGRWSAEHRRAAVVGWLVFVVIAALLGGMTGTKKIVQGSDGAGESGHAQKLLYDHFPQPAAERVLVQSSTLTVRDAGFRAAVEDEVSRLSRLNTVEDLRSPLARGNSGQISAGGHSVLISFSITGKFDSADKRVAPSLAATAAAQRAHPGMRIAQAGDASSVKALNDSFSRDFAKSRTLSLPITMVILVFAFGALMAALIPVLLAVTAVVATLGLVGLVSQFAPVDSSVAEVVLIIGMAVGVDYSLFYMRREREERAAGRDEQAALQAAAATSGRSVLVSGCTVMAAMAGMYLVGNQTFAGIATGTIIVVGVAMLASVTVLPAVLSKLGDKVMRLRVPFVAARRETGVPSRFWSAVLDQVLRRPAVSVVIAGGALVALAIPAFGLKTSVPGWEALPHGLSIVRTVDRMQKAFPGGALPAQVVVRAGDVDSPAAAGATRRLERGALASGQMHEPITVQTSADRHYAVISIPMSGKGTDAVSNAALATLRNELIPATVGQVGGASTWVTGQTAISKDFNDLMKARAPLVFAFVLALAFILLLVTFRSIVIPLKAIVLNLLSVGAAYGVLVLVFQHKWAEGLLSFKSTGAITSWLPVFLFAILFGLSMDYHVLIISRVREAFDSGMKTEDAVAHGIKATAGPVTSAAIVMVAVFAIFASLGELEFKQVGLGLAIAILLDATLIRGVLLPATMKLLGDWNWYLPKGLRWLPRIGPEPRVVPEPAR